MILNTDSDPNKLFAKWEAKYNAAIAHLGITRKDLEGILLDIEPGHYGAEDNLPKYQAAFDNMKNFLAVNVPTATRNKSLTETEKQSLGPIFYPLLDKVYLTAIIDGRKYWANQSMFPWANTLAIENPEAVGISFNPFTETWYPQYTYRGPESALGPYRYFYIYDGSPSYNSALKSFVSNPFKILRVVAKTGLQTHTLDPNTGEWQWYRFMDMRKDEMEYMFSGPQYISEVVGPAAFNSPELKKLFKPVTNYIEIGDEPKGGKGLYVIDLRTMLPADAYDNLRKYLTLMPRQLLWDFFMQKIWPGIPQGVQEVPFEVTSIYGDTHQNKSFESLIWGAFVDLFNEANLEYINAQQISPWAWEGQKMDAYLVSQSEEAIAELENEISANMDISLALDKEANKIMEQYIELPRLGDTGLEISRQNAIKELLKKKDYVTAQAAVDAFKYISQSELGPALAQPIPFDITSEDGEVSVKATTEGSI